MEVTDPAAAAAEATRTVTTVVTVAAAMEEEVVVVVAAATAEVAMEGKFTFFPTRHQRKLVRSVDLLRRAGPPKTMLPTNVFL